jgi:hypothetical protein
MRLHAINCLYAAYAQPNTKLVKEKLFLNTEEDALSFQKACGWSMVENA